MPFAADAAGDVAFTVEPFDGPMEYGEHDGAFRADGPVDCAVAFKDIRSRGIANVWRILIVKTAFQHEPLDSAYVPVHRRDAVFFQPDHEGETAGRRISAQ